MVGGSKGHAPCKALLLPQSLFLCQFNSMEIIGLSLSCGIFGHLQFLWISPNLLHSFKLNVSGSGYYIFV